MLSLFFNIHSKRLILYCPLLRHQTVVFLQYFTQRYYFHSDGPVMEISIIYEKTSVNIYYSCPTSYKVYFIYMFCIIRSYLQKGAFYITYVYTLGCSTHATQRWMSVLTCNKKETQDLVNLWCPTRVFTCWVGYSSFVWVPT